MEVLWEKRKKIIQLSYQHTHLSFKSWMFNGKTMSSNYINDKLFLGKVDLKKKLKILIYKKKHSSKFLHHTTNLDNRKPRAWAKTLESDPQQWIRLFLQDNLSYLSWIWECNICFHRYNFFSDIAFQILYRTHRLAYFIIRSLTSIRTNVIVVQIFIV